MKKLVIIIFILYSVLIFKLIVFKYPSGMTFGIANSNLTPFKTIMVYISGKPTWEIAMQNLLGNIIILVPYGFLLGLFYQKIRLFIVLLVGLSVGVILEFLQFVFKSGIPDIDDIILNSLGVVTGYLLFVYIKKYEKKYYKKD